MLKRAKQTAQDEKISFGQGSIYVDIRKRKKIHHVQHMRKFATMARLLREFVWWRLKLENNFTHLKAREIIWFLTKRKSLILQLHHMIS